jgi:hypothetical protein
MQIVVKLNVAFLKDGRKIDTYLSKHKKSTPWCQRCAPFWKLAQWRYLNLSGKVTSRGTVRWNMKRGSEFV